MESTEEQEREHTPSADEPSSEQAPKSPAPSPASDPPPDLPLPATSALPSHFSTAEDVCMEFMDAFIEDLLCETQELHMQRNALHKAVQDLWAPLKDSVEMALLTPEEPLDQVVPVVCKESWNLHSQTLQNLPLGHNHPEMPPKSTTKTRLTGLQRLHDRIRNQEQKHSQQHQAASLILQQLFFEFPWSRLQVHNSSDQNSGGLFALTSVENCHFSWQIPVDRLFEFMEFLCLQLPVDLMPSDEERIAATTVSSLTRHRTSPSHGNNSGSLRAGKFVNIVHKLVVEEELHRQNQPGSTTTAVTTCGATISGSNGATVGIAGANTIVGVGAPDDAVSPCNFLMCFAHERAPRRCESDRHAAGGIKTKRAKHSASDGPPQLNSKQKSTKSIHSTQSNKWSQMRKQLENMGVIAEQKPEPMVVSSILTHLFSMGTPRQMTGEELARRNDLLAVLEREEAKKQKHQAFLRQLTGVDEAFTVEAGEGAEEEDGDPDSTLRPRSSVIIEPATAALAEEHGGRRKSKFELSKIPPRFQVNESTFIEEQMTGGISDSVNTSDIVHGGEAMTTKSTKAANTTKSGSIGFSPIKPLAATSTKKKKQLMVNAMSSEHLQKQQDDWLQNAIEPLSHRTALPEIETSRLATGVRAVVHGVEKKGPTLSPSRHSRTRMHNYYQNEQPDPSYDFLLAQSMAKTIQTNGSDLESTEDSASFPAYSPIKTSPHRRLNKASASHATKSTNAASKYVPTISHQDAAQLMPQLQTPPTVEYHSLFPSKQQAWDRKVSPPRVRNRHIPEPKHRKSRQFSLRVLQQHEQNTDSEDLMSPLKEESDLPSSTTHHQLHAPRRVPLHDEHDEHLE